MSSAVIAPIAMVMSGLLAIVGACVIAREVIPDLWRKDRLNAVVVGIALFDLALDVASGVLHWIVR